MPKEKKRDMGALPPAFWWTFLCMAIYGRTNDQARAAKIVSFAHAVLTLTLCLLYVARNGYGFVCDIWGTDLLSRRICDISAGYMLYDMYHVMTLKKHRIFLTHHVLSLVGLQMHVFLGAFSIINVHNLLAAELGGVFFQLNRTYPQNRVFAAMFPVAIVATRLLYFPLIVYWHFLRMTQTRFEVLEIAKLVVALIGQGGIIAINLRWLAKLITTRRIV